MERKNTNRVYIELSEWLVEQPYWLQDAAWNIYNGKEIDDSKINNYVKFCVNQVQKQNVAFNCLQQSDLVTEESPVKISVTKLSDIKNVNDLGEEAKLEFDENGINVIYGLNGSGKSSYMRMFKHVSRTPYKELIQTNVFKKKSDIEQTCKFTIIEDGTEREIKTDLKKPINDFSLQLMDVFDTRISYEYLTNENNATYQPFVFSVMEELAKTGDKIKDKISEKIELINTIKIEIPEEYRQQKSSEWLVNLKPGDIIQNKYLKWSKEQEKLLNDIPREIDKEKQNRILENIEMQIKLIDPILNDLHDVERTFINDDIKIKTLNSRYFKAKDNLERSEVLFKETASEIDIISVDSSEWKSMLGSARKYYEEFIFKENEPHFAEEGSICPLCHQEILGEIQKRLLSVDNYINGKFNTKYDEVKDEVFELANKIGNRKYVKNQLEEQLKDILDKDLYDEIISTYVCFESLKDEKNAEKCLIKLENVDYKSSLIILKEKLEFLQKEKNSTIETMKDETILKKEEQLRELKLHKWIYDNIKVIENKIQNLNLIKTYNEAIKLTKTNAITRQTNVLADELITEAYIKRFDFEIKHMAPKLKVKLEKAKSSKGKTPFKVTIDNGDGAKCKIEDILSEGEQRIVSLAIFFADATGSDDFAPIVIDDPISSLDINYERSATKRIVELAQNRQVIVFTHRISLLKELESLSKENTIEYNDIYIKSSNKGKGMLDYENFYKGSVKKRLNELLNEISSIKQMDEDSRGHQSAKDEICQKFRICVEHSVEDDLLNGIVKRFDRQIRTQNKLGKLASITKKDCKIIDDMMTKYSFIEHSQPLDSPKRELSIDDIEKDIKMYRDWNEDFLARA